MADVIFMIGVLVLAVMFYAKGYMDGTHSAILQIRKWKEENLRKWEGEK